MGTTQNYFENFLYRKDQKLQFKSGTYFKNTFDVVIEACSQNIKL